MKLPQGWYVVAGGKRWYEHATGAVVRWLSSDDPVLHLPRSGWVAWQANSENDADFVGVFATMHEAMREAMRIATE